MANAYKCDRCGALYSCEPDNEVYLYNKDLCSRCQEQLDAWFVDPSTFVVSYIEVEGDGYKHKSIKAH